MARKPRIEYDGAVYHVMSRGDRGEAVFLAESLWLALRKSWRPHAGANGATMSTKRSGILNYRTDPFTDDETGLLYYGYRYYSPGMGRWINRDPIEEAGGYGIYVYLLNGPLSRVDFLGLAPDESGNEHPPYTVTSAPILGPVRRAWEELTSFTLWDDPTMKSVTLNDACMIVILHHHGIYDTDKWKHPPAPEDVLPDDVVIPHKFTFKHPETQRADSSAV